MRSPKRKLGVLNHPALTVMMAANRDMGGKFSRSRLIRAVTRPPFRDELGRKGWFERIARARPHLIRRLQLMINGRPRWSRPLRVVFLSDFHTGWRLRRRRPPRGHRHRSSNLQPRPRFPRWRFCQYAAVRGWTSATRRATPSSRLKRSLMPIVAVCQRLRAGAATAPPVAIGAGSSSM